MKVISIEVYGNEILNFQWPKASVFVAFRGNKHLHNILKVLVIVYIYIYINIYKTLLCGSTKRILLKYHIFKIVIEKAKVMMYGI